jgi:hypothetical protein
MVILRANDGSASHAVIIGVDGIIFDTTQSHAMKLRGESFD